MLSAFPALRLNQFRIGKPGSCQDYQLFGECKREGCTFIHKETYAPEDQKKEAVKAMKAFAESLR